MRQTKESVAPQVLKRGVLFSMAAERQIKTLVETGTYLGDTIMAGLVRFDEIYSIEIQPELHDRAKRIFAGNSKVELYQGDSGEQLGQIVPQLKESVVFWLDGHYSGHITGKGGQDTPIYKELDTVLASPFAHLIIIDDAREFGTNPHYPSLDELKSYLSQSGRRHDWMVIADVIIIELLAV
ncbi:MAG: hypothetical protein AAGF85_16000 [Bacteroidota bacterium]